MTIWHDHKIGVWTICQTPKKDIFSENIKNHDFHPFSIIYMKIALSLRYLHVSDL